MADGPLNVISIGGLETRCRDNVQIEEKLNDMMID